MDASQASASQQCQDVSNFSSMVLGVLFDLDDHPSRVYGLQGEATMGEGSELLSGKKKNTGTQSSGGAGVGVRWLRF